ncbi:ATP-dependent nuclease [Pseudomonas sp. NPDC089401]|uniref:ATP-dependent nuclease n=1 Tax=Pseudomonas sp. NPDC089401 TaxID=3364462 RepID=UPI0037FB155F
MKIEKIWITNIRTLHPTEAWEPGDVPWATHFARIRNTKPVNVQGVNILIGENGSGKSTLIDIIRGLRDRNVLASLPRENPAYGTYPAYSIQFSDGSQWTYLFSTPTDPSLDPLEYVYCQQRIDQFVDRFGLHGPQVTLTDNTLLSKRPPATGTAGLQDLQGVYYLNGTPIDLAHDHTFTKALNSIRHLIPGILTHKDRHGEPEEILESFGLSDTGSINVWLGVDSLMPNNLPAEWLPSGWRAYAKILQWLESCPTHSICLIEEPERSLHPNLTRSLTHEILRTSKEKQQQIFITTHCAAMIDAATQAKINILQCSGTSIEETPNLKHALDRMGYLASDLLMSNCIIWVEGPSDRIYINYWIKGISPTLFEGVHYSIMFYGGRLLSRLTMNEHTQAMNDLINLTHLNPKAAVIIDSDKRSEHWKINETKQRLIGEFSGSPYRMHWVTKGREIENYLNPAHLSSSIKDQHPLALKQTESGQWANLMKYKKRYARKSSVANKVDVAERYTMTHEPEYTFLDLSDRINELCNFIKRCNGNLA